MVNNNPENFLVRSFKTLSPKRALLYLFIASFIVYGNSLFNSFVWDDVDQLVNNHVVHSLSNILLFFTSGNFPGNYGGTALNSYYRPIMALCFSFLYLLFGPSPFPFHFFQLVLFVINSFLLYLVLKYFFNKPLSFILSLVFLIHPINQEPAAFISNLQDALFFFFGMLSLLVLISEKEHVKSIILINVFLFLSFLSKETGLLFVPVLIAYQFLFHKKNVSKVFVISLLITTACFLFFRFQILQIKVIPGPFVPISLQPFPQRLLNIPEIIFYYLKSFFFPYQFSVDQQWIVTKINFQTFSLPLFIDSIFFILLALLGGYIYTRKITLFKAYVFFLLIFLAGLSFHLQIITFDMTVADRWFYFPMVGLLGIIGISLSSVRLHANIMSNIFLTVCIFILFILAVLTIGRNADWVDNLTLFSHDVRINTNSARLSWNLGLEYMSIGQSRNANTQFERVAKLAPSFGQNWYELGLTYEATGNIEKAREDYLKSIQVSEDFGGYEKLVPMYLIKDNNPKKAIALSQRGLKRYPNHPLLLSFLSIAEYKLHNNQMALNLAKQSYFLSPNDAVKDLIYSISNNLPFDLRKYTQPQ